MSDDAAPLVRQGAYMPALDGVRAIAIALVMLFHAHHPYLPGAFAGVDIFFVLGGYLITWMLQAEYQRVGRIDLKAFYIRRIGRLVPALAAMLLVYLIVAPWVWPGQSHLLQASLALLGVADYTRAFAGIPLFLTHTWSLAVEHHFYVLWPLLLPLVLRARRPLLILGGLYLAAWVWRIACLQIGQDWQQMYYRFDTRFSGLVLGGWLAVLLDRVEARHWFDRYRKFLPISIVLIAILMLTQHWKDDVFWVSGLPALELAVVMLVTGAAMGVSGLGWLGWSWLRFIGKISYGLYLWHYPIFFSLRERYDWDHVLLLGGGLSFFAASLSWCTVERWGHGWRKRWLQRRDAARTAATLAPGSVRES